MMENSATLILVLFMTILIPCKSSNFHIIDELDYYINTWNAGDNSNANTIEGVPETASDTVRTFGEIKINDPSNPKYLQVAKMSNKQGTLSVKLTSRLTNEFIFFGKSTSDYITFTDKLKSAAGMNGADTYKVPKGSPTYIWINNQATDNVLDTLELPTEAAAIYTTGFDNSTVGKSQNDLVLRYFNTIRDEPKFVVLKNYLKSDLSMHLRLKISSEDFFMFVPRNWVPLKFDRSQYHLDGFNTMYSLRDKPFPYNMPIKSEDSFPILNVYDKNCSFYLRKNSRGRKVINLYINDGRGNAEAMYARLVHLLNDNGTVSDAWSKKFFFVVYDDNTPRKMLTIAELLATLN